MGIDIRSFCGDRDLPGLRSCFVALQDHEHEFAPEAPTGAAIVDDYVTFMIERSSSPDAHLLVAEVGGRIVGFGSLVVSPRIEPDDIDVVHAEVVELSVLPPFRGRGIGGAILAELEARAREGGATSLRVRVDARNSRARRLYERDGFHTAVLHMHKAIQNVPAPVE